MVELEKEELIIETEDKLQLLNMLTRELLKTSLELHDTAEDKCQKLSFLTEKNERSALAIAHLSNEVLKLYLKLIK